jgi:hypothetical protein
MWAWLRRILDLRQIVLVAVTLFVLPAWFLNYESILQATGLDKIFVDPEGRFVTALKAIILFIQGDLVKGLIIGGLIVAFLPMIGRIIVNRGQALHGRLLGVRLDSTAGRVGLLPIDAPSKLAALDEALEILGHGKKLAQAIREGRSLRSRWQQEIRDGRMQEYQERLSEYRESFVRLIREIIDMHGKCEKYPDIQEVINSYDLIKKGEGSAYVYGLSEFREMMQRLGPNPTENHMQLFEPYVDKYRRATNNLEEWRKQASTALLTLRQQISC